MISVGKKSVRIPSAYRNSTDSQEIQFEDVEAWEATTDTYSITVKGRPRSEFIMENAADLYSVMSRKLSTRRWRGVVGGIKEGCGLGGIFTVAKAPLGTPATVEFKDECLIVTDRSLLGKKGGVPVREIPYTQIESWEAGVGEWGLDLTIPGKHASAGKYKLAFMVSLNDMNAMRAELDSRVKTIEVIGSLLLLDGESLEEDEALLNEEERRKDGSIETREIYLEPIFRLDEASFSEEEKPKPKPYFGKKKKKNLKEEALETGIRFVAMMMPAGRPVVVFLDEDSMRVTARNDTSDILKSALYNEIEGWEASAEIWRYTVKGRDVAFMTDTALEMKEILTSKVTTVKWDIEMGDIKACDEKGKKIKIFTASGGQQELTFKESGLLFSDVSGQKHTMKILGYHEIKWQHINMGSWGITLDDAHETQVRYTTPQVDEIRTEMSKRLNFKVIRGFCELADTKGENIERVSPIEMQSTIRKEPSVDKTLKASSKTSKTSKSIIKTLPSIASFPVLWMPDGASVRLNFTDEGLQLVDRADASRVLKACSYQDVEHWEEEADVELFGYTANGKVIKVVSKDAILMKDLIVSKVRTTQWNGKVGSLTDFAEEGPQFTVLQRGVQTTIDFRATCLLITDRSQTGQNVKGGVRRVAYGDIEWWHLRTDDFGLTLRKDSENLLFATDQRQELREELEQRVVTRCLTCYTSPTDVASPSPNNSSPSSPTSPSSAFNHSAYKEKQDKAQKDQAELDSRLALSNTWRETQAAVPFKGVIMEPSGEQVVVWIGESEISVTQGAKARARELLTMSYYEAEGWSVTHDSWSIFVRGREFAFHSQKASEIHLEFSQNISTMEWNGVVAAPLAEVDRVGIERFTVLKAPLGNMVKLEFKPDAIHIQLTTSKQPPTVVRYEEVLTWTLKEESWGFTTADSKPEIFLTDESDAVHFAFVARFSGNSSCKGSKLIYPIPDKGPTCMRDLAWIQAVSIPLVAPEQTVIQPAAGVYDRSRVQRAASKGKKFSCMMQPTGEQVCLLMSEATLQVTSRHDTKDVLKEFPYASMTISDEVVEAIFSFHARERVFSFVSDEAEDIKEAAIEMMNAEPPQSAVA